MAKQWFKSPEEAAADLTRRGYEWIEDMGRYQRGSWYAHVRQGRRGFYVETT